jgi:hypothetical protein
MMSAITLPSHSKDVQRHPKDIATLDGLHPSLKQESEKAGLLTLVDEEMCVIDMMRCTELWPQGFPVACGD